MAALVHRRVASATAGAEAFTPRPTCTTVFHPIRVVVITLRTPPDIPPQRGRERALSRERHSRQLSGRWCAPRLPNGAPPGTHAPRSQGQPAYPPVVSHVSDGFRNTDVR